MTAGHLPDGDYVLIDGRGWFTVGKWSVRIAAEAGGIRVEVYADGHEMDEPFAQCWADDSEVDQFLEDLQKMEVASGGIRE